MVKGNYAKKVESLKIFCLGHYSWLWLSSRPDNKKGRNKEMFAQNGLRSMPIGMPLTC